MVEVTIQTRLKTAQSAAQWAPTWVLFQYKLLGGFSLEEFFDR